MTERPDLDAEVIAKLKHEIRAWRQAFSAAERFYLAVDTTESRTSPAGQARAQGAAGYRGHLLRALKADNVHPTRRTP